MQAAEGTPQLWFDVMLSEKPAWNIATLPTLHISLLPPRSHWCSCLCRSVTNWSKQLMQQKKHLTKIEIQVVILKIGMCIWRAVYCLGFLLFCFSFFFKLGNVVLEKKIFPLFRSLSGDGWPHGHEYGLVLEDNLRTAFKTWCTPVVSYFFCTLAPFEKNTHRTKELSLESGGVTRERRPAPLCFLCTSCLSTARSGTSLSSLSVLVSLSFLAMKGDLQV